jgi:hypothetical protein
MLNEGARDLVSSQDFATAVAEFIRTRGVTRCPTACVLPTQASVADADREALGEHAARRDQHRQAKVAARVKRLWNIEAVPSTRE